MNRVGGGWWSKTEELPDAAWGQALNVWEAYLAIYSATKDEKWLDKLSLQIDAMLMRRDVETGRRDFRGNSLPSWSYSSDINLYEGYYFTEYVGLILHPILRFVEEVRANSVERYDRKAEEYLQACIDALAVFDKDILENMETGISAAACYDLWREEPGTAAKGYYVGHLYYALDPEKFPGYAPDHMLPYNQSLSVAQCYPVLYRLTGVPLWRDKTEKSWNWFREGIQKEDDGWWWYYAKYFNWNREKGRIPMQEAEVPKTHKEYYYEDFAGHYSVDLMFMIEAHQIGVISDEDLYQIGENKKTYGLSKRKWPEIMKVEPGRKNNLKAAQYFDYFAVELKDRSYCKQVFPVLQREIERQDSQGKMADMSNENNGTCLRLLAAAYVANEYFLSDRGREEIQNESSGDRGRGIHSRLSEDIFGGEGS